MAARGIQVERTGKNERPNPLGPLGQECILSACVLTSVTDQAGNSDFFSFSPVKVRSSMITEGRWRSLLDTGSICLPVSEGMQVPETSSTLDKALPPTILTSQS